MLQDTRAEPKYIAIAIHTYIHNNYICKQVILAIDYTCIYAHLHVLAIQSVCMLIIIDNEEYNIDEDDYKEEVWWENEISETIFDYDSADNDAPELPEENEASFSNNTFGHKLLKWVLIFIIRLQAKHYIPDAGILSILKFMAAVLSLLDKQNGSHLAKKFPSSKDALFKHLKLKENFERFVVCYKCQSVYKKVAVLKRVALK